jgi:hypothetical protein
MDPHDTDISGELAEFVPIAPGPLGLYYYNLISVTLRHAFNEYFIWLQLSTKLPWQEENMQSHCADGKHARPFGIVGTTL